MSVTVRMVRVAAGQPAGPEGPIDASRVQAGAPWQGAHNAFSNGKGNFHCGVWCSSEGRWSIRYTEDEFCYLIEGAAVITDAAGHAERVQAGDAFVIPAGFSGSWETLGSVRKFYAIYEEP